MQLQHLVSGGFRAAPLGRCLRVCPSAAPPPRTREADLCRQLEGQCQQSLLGAVTPGACISVRPLLSCPVVKSVCGQDLTHMPLGVGRVSGVNPVMGEICCPGESGWSRGHWPESRAFLALSGSIQGSCTPVTLQADLLGGTREPGHRWGHGLSPRQDGTDILGGVTAPGPSWGGGNHATFHLASFSPAGKVT